MSTVLHWLAGRRLNGLWILPDEAIYGHRALELWHSGRLPILGGQGAGYSVLYPMLAGFPLSIGSLATGYASLKLLQALVVSLAAVPVFAYCRRLVSPGYALAAAALTACSPLLLYSGLLMTEVLFYPLVAWTLLAVAQAVATASRRDQALVFALLLADVLTRTQAVILLPVFGAAVLLDAVFGRTRQRLRAFWPLWVLIVLAALVVVVAPGTFGSYAGTLRGSYPVGLALGLVFEHLALAVVGTAVLPAAALALLSAEAARARVDEPEVRSLVATAVSAVVLVCVQVGFFAARFAPHLLERDLAALPPILFAVFVVWLGRGAHRPIVVVAVTSFAVAALALLVPWNRLVAPVALPDSFGIALLLRLQAHNPADIVAVAVPLLLLVFALVPRRWTPLLIGVAAALLVATSAVASNSIARLDRAEQEQIVGTPRDWVDRAVDGPVGYFYDGETYWNTVYQQRFWNRRIDRVAATTPVPGPMPQTPFRIGPDGAIPLHEKWVVASDQHVLTGTPVAHVTERNSDVTGLTLWEVDGHPQLSLEKYGFLPNGDMVAPAVVKVWGCQGGKLQLTLLPKATKELIIELDGRVVVDRSIANEAAAHIFVPVPPSPRPHMCNFRIVPQSLLGSTVVQFLRP
ncbi:MAG TPA: glycosyltransferase family 39 protein [Gaiellaceae bacterium]|nr:glycosyltransferase family 39 protein [Gaiellaceae bacterium]